MNQYLSMFIDESREHLQAMNDNMLALEADPKNVGIVQVIFRSAHTLKGMSATMGFEDVASLTHEMENVLDLVRNSKLEMNPSIIDVLFKSLDALEAMIQDIEAGGIGKADVSSIVAALKSIESGDYAKGGGTSAAGSQMSAERSENKAGALDMYQHSVLVQSLQSGYHALRIEVGIERTCVMKAARAFMVFNLLEQNGEVVKAEPAVEDIEQEKFDFSFTVYFVTRGEPDALKSMIENISEIESVRVQALTEQSLNESLVRMQADAAAQAAAPASAAQETNNEAAVRPKAAGGGAVSRTIRVDIDRLDVLMNLFSELLIDRVRLEQLASEIRRNDLTETIEHMSRVSSDLQNIVMKLRMVPVETVFNRFPRMVRDLAKSLGKKVDLVVTGAETELDRTVIDEIGDPLVHMLRNSVDHGIETVEERLAAGKSETGTVHLRAFHSGNHVFIEIEDDGRGINRDKVLSTAIRKGIVSPEQGAAMKDEEVYLLLFAPGFSTADKISDISGRGVGLDVVKSKIESLGGQVSIQSKPGEGTKFSVQLPLTLSIISALLVRLGNEKYAIPLSSIVETSVIRRDAVRHVHGTPVIDFREGIIPIVSLAELFEVPGNSAEGKTETEIVVVRKGDKLAALMVDEFIGQQEIVLKSLGHYLTNLFAISGATILGDGQVALIIDTNALIK
jgi:two-component system chemotaxis sensor kinase CheA